ncbi:class II aldolase/adducin family protein [Paracoccaceae bacterium Fryx2]|nr:class II aldolase/adducin family protein [Paracoccaceae bacterium Fryx2]
MDTPLPNRWDDTAAAAWVAAAGDDPADRDLALRIYTSRLIGGDPDLVLHGGGNTSVKTLRPDADGKPRAVMHVKGSGWDLATIEAPGLPAVELAPLLASRHAAPLSDPEMVGLLRANLLDPASPNPSLETLLHAFLPARFVDHSHATAVLVLVNQPDAAEIGQRIYGGQLAIVPYVMPGYDLSIEAARIFDANPECKGLWLVNHGLFTFGKTARESYDRMITFVNMAEDFLASAGVTVLLIEPPQPADDRAQAFGALLADRLRAAGPVFAAGAALDFRQDTAIRTLLARDDLPEIASRGTVTPDHVIRIKAFPLILDGTENAADIDAALDRYAERYRTYFRQEASRATEPKVMLDPLPRVVHVRSLGLFGVGRTGAEAAIAADLASQTARVILAAEAIGAFTPLSRNDLFNMEYWSLEQAKLKK